MKIKKIIPIYTLITGLLFVTSCELQDIPDANNPSVSSVTSNATVGQLQNLITGLESRSKEYVGTASNAFGTFDRDIWYFNGADPRNVQYWTGQAEAVPSSTFYGVDAAYTGPYSAIKQANVLIDPLNPGPFVSYTEALTAIKKILDEGYTALSNAGSTLPFTLTKGYTDFNTPAGLGKVNRALAARVAIYQKDWQGALDALSKSFFNLNGDLNIGPAHVYGNPPETYNPLYFVLDASYNSGAVVHPSLIADALPGDSRVKTKFFHRTTPLVSTAGKVALSSEYQDKRWADATSPIKYIRNEELVLIYAEASAQLNKTVDAVTAINIIRSSANLAPYTGATDLGSLITEILFQRRYSLWFEPAAHRWIDLRRYGRLNEIPVALDKGVVFTQLAIPISEVNWDKFKNK